MFLKVITMQKAVKTSRAERIEADIALAKYVFSLRCVLPVAPCHAPVDDSEFSCMSDGQRRAVQFQEIAHQVKQAGLFTPGVALVEFGAGKGQLGRCLVKASGGGVHYVSVDHRKQCEPLHAGEADKVTVEHMCADICTLTPDDFAHASSGCASVVVVSNHLCGHVLDVALRGSVNAWATRGTAAYNEALDAVARTEHDLRSLGQHDVPLAPAASPASPEFGAFPASSSLHPAFPASFPAPFPASADIPAVDCTASGSRLAGVFAVTCCHHLCSWETFVGRDIFSSWGLSRRDFERVRSWSRMAPKRVVRESPRRNVAKTAARLRISYDECEALGQRCRRLIDTARALYLRRAGLEVKLVHHVPVAATGDNCMLKAVLPHHQALP
mmetsp:Transcript_5322/g.11557  ORF Transcript_5322/g.11557 Transcript_5322/m.11557 type:complete len:385 (+) Transcript_5322:254-1408(+)